MGYKRLAHRGRKSIEEKVLELYGNETYAVNEAIDRIVVGIYEMKREYKASSFLFTGIGSGVGTTTVALGIAIALSEAGWKTLFVDCDFRKGNEFKRISAPAGMDLATYLTEDNVKESDIICNTTYENLSYIASGERYNTPVRLLCSEKMEALCDDFKSSYDFVIYDLPSISIVNDAKVLIPSVDRYVLVGGINISTKKQIFDAKLALVDYANKNGGIIANRMDKYQYRKNVKDYNYFEEKNLRKTVRRRRKFKSTPKNFNLTQNDIDLLTQNKNGTKEGENR